MPKKTPREKTKPVIFHGIFLSCSSPLFYPLSVTTNSPQIHQRHAKKRKMDWKSACRDISFWKEPLEKIRMPLTVPGSLLRQKISILICWGVHIERTITLRNFWEVLIHSSDRSDCRTFGWTSSWTKIEVYETSSWKHWKSSDSIKRSKTTAAGKLHLLHCIPVKMYSVLYCTIVLSISCISSGIIVRYYNDVDRQDFQNYADFSAAFLTNHDSSGSQKTNVNILLGVYEPQVSNR